MFNMLESKDKDTDTANDATATTATQTASFTMASTLGTTYGGVTTIPLEISTAINQLAANQLAIQQQMAAMTFTANAPAHHTQFQIPPIQNMGQQPFAGAAQGSFNTGQGGGGRQRGGRGRGCMGSRGGGRGRGLFAQQFQGGFGGIPPFVNGPPAAVVPPTGAWVNAPFQSNTTKKYANWNVCWLCGFEVEDGHTLATCPTHWRKTDHQVGFTRSNAQQWINQGYAPCTKGMHKNKLPQQPGQFRWWGAEIAHKCKSLSSASFLNPTENPNLAFNTGNDDVMVVISNLANKNRQPPHQPPTLVTPVANTLYGSPWQNYINAITIAPNHAVADTGAISIFVMDGVDVANRRVATKPLIVNLPDGRKVKSTHACGINIPRLPVTLAGHIILDLKTALLIGICLLCKVGCKVVFDDVKCDVVYEGCVILRGYKDMSMDL
jgi:hypothetical protein